MNKVRTLTVDDVNYDPYLNSEGLWIPILAWNPGLNAYEAYYQLIGNDIINTVLNRVDVKQVNKEGAKVNPSTREFLKFLLENEYIDEDKGIESIRCEICDDRDNYDCGCRNCPDSDLSFNVWVGYILREYKDWKEKKEGDAIQAARDYFAEIATQPVHDEEMNF